MHIATLANIPLRLHWSFLAVVAGYAAFSWASSGLAAVAEAGLLGLALFGSVVLHELGHALAARYFGIQTRHITLYPFGGIAAIEQMPQNPLQEFIIAIAGPLVNAAIVVIVTPFALITGWWALGMVAVMNLVMGVFNLLPAFPMDGGRVLRAGLSLPLGYVRASLLSMTIGRLFALAFIVGGFVWWTPGLILVGAFLLLAIRMERQRLAWQVRMSSYRPAA